MKRQGSPKHIRGSEGWLSERAGNPDTLEVGEGGLPPLVPASKDSKRTGASRASLPLMCKSGSQVLLFCCSRTSQHPRARC